MKKKNENFKMKRSRQTVSKTVEQSSQRIICSKSFLIFVATQIVDSYWEGDIC